MIRIICKNPTGLWAIKDVVNVILDHLYSSTDECIYFGDQHYFETTIAKKQYDTTHYIKLIQIIGKYKKYKLLRILARSLTDYQLSDQIIICLPKLDHMAAILFEHIDNKNKYINIIFREATQLSCDILCSVIMDYLDKHRLLHIIDWLFHTRLISFANRYYKNMGIPGLYCVVDSELFQELYDWYSFDITSEGMSYLREINYPRYKYLQTENPNLF